MKKIVTVLGARPQFIKAAVVSHVLAASNKLTEVLIQTGQHFDVNMSDVFISELGMEQPAYQLDIHGDLHGAMTARMLIEVEKILLAERPDAAYNTLISTIVATGLQTSAVAGIQNITV